MSIPSPAHTPRNQPGVHRDDPTHGDHQGVLWIRTAWGERGYLRPPSRSSAGVFIYVWLDVMLGAQWRVAQRTNQVAVYTWDDCD